MLFAPARFASRRDTIAFVVCIVLSIGARFAPVDFQRNVASFMRNTVLRPLLGIERQAVALQTAIERAEDIRWQRDSLAAEALELLQLREENSRLREQVGLGARQPWGPVPAAVLHSDEPTGVTLLLSAGSDQGVRAGNPVVALQPEERGTETRARRLPGLLGVIKSTDADRSTVTLWTDPNFGAGAMTADGEALGIVRSRGTHGPNANMMELIGIPFLEVVDTGTAVVTSGEGLGRGGVYPRGLLLGVVEVVEEIEEERKGWDWSRTYFLRPAVQPIAVSHVIILTRPGDDVTNAFVVDST